MANRYQAAGIISLTGLLSFYVPPLATISGAAIALVALSLGPAASMQVLAVAMLIAGLVSSIVLGNPVAGVATLLVTWLPAVIGARVLRTYSSQTILLVAVALMAAVFALGLRWYAGDVAVWWKQMLGPGVDMLLTDMSPDRKAAIIEEVAVRLNSFFAAVLLVNYMVIMLLARWWQALLYNPGGFRKEFCALRLPRETMFVVLLIGGLAGLDPEYNYFDDLLYIVVMMFLFQGLAVAHSVVKSRNLHRMVLIITYVLLALASSLMVFLLAGLGMLDSLLDIRRLRQSESPQ
jgi:hypothetical protein